MRRLRSEHGFALPFALAVLIVSSIMLVSIVEYSSSNSRAAAHGKSTQNAFTLAEAGINNAMAVLSKPENNALDPCLLRPQPPTSECETLLGAGYQPFESVYEGGKVVWYGVLDELNAVWTLTSTGKVANPTGQAAEVTRTLTAKVPVTPTNTQPLNNAAWDYIMSTRTGNTCDMTIGSDVEVRTNLYVLGNLCLQQQAKVLRGSTEATRLVVKDKLSQATTNNTVGTSSSPMSEVHVGTGCKYFTQHWHPASDGHPFCSTVDKVYATTLDQNPGTLVAPMPAWSDWWRNGSPGPFFDCTTGGPITFDNDTTTTTGPNRSVTTTYNLTPSASYSCWTAGGELSWDASAKVLTVRGTIFFDGHVRVDPPTANVVVQYNGQASIYAYGSVVVNNVKLCAGVSNGECSFDSWNPNTEMLVFVSNGDGGQTNAAAGQSIVVLSSQFQGALFGTNKVVIDTFSKVDGPMIGSEVSLGQSVDTSDFPPIMTVPAGMPGNPTVYAQPNAPRMFSG